MGERHDRTWKIEVHTTGPCFPNEHYVLDALGRLPDIELLVASRLYFVLQRVTNGKGQVRREMALGSGRLDLCIEFGKGRGGG